MCINNFILHELAIIKSCLKKLVYCSLLLFFGCSQQVVVKEEYTVWGEAIALTREPQSTPLHLQILESKSIPKACLLIVHGMNEYVGRYYEIAQYFAKDFKVIGFDFSAHGLSNSYFLAAHQAIVSGKEQFDVSDAYLEQAQLNNLNRLRQDLDLALQYAIASCNGKPLFILSHSLGSLVSASYLLQQNDTANLQHIKGIVFTGPAFSITQVPNWTGYFANPFIDFSFYLHRHYLYPNDELFPLLAFNQTVSFFGTPLFDAMIQFFSLPTLRNLFSPNEPDWVVEHLSDWEEERELHRNDKYIIRRTVLSYVLGIEKEVIQFRRDMENFKIPYLLVYSEFDPITPAWGNTDFAAATLKHHQDNEIMLLKDASHHEQLFSSPGLRQQVLEKIDAWLLLRLKCEEI